MSTILAAIVKYVRLDWPIAIFAVLYLALFAPLVPRNADNPDLLAAYSNDEPFLTMALEATLVAPYGNPGAYFDPTKSAAKEIPERWGEKRYFNITYYGGALFQLTFPVYAGLRSIGLPPFPTGPILLRIVTLLAGLLALILLYNIGRERGSRLAGLLAVVFVATDVSFLYYANFIHPDTLQMLFGLGVLLAAAAHARSGSTRTLIALGLLCGVVQGTKSGGPWTVPVALLAVWLGARASNASSGFRHGPAARFTLRAVGRCSTRRLLHHNAIRVPRPLLRQVAATRLRHRQRRQPAAGGSDLAPHLDGGRLPLYRTRRPLRSSPSRLRGLSGRCFADRRITC